MEDQELTIPTLQTKRLQLEPLSMYHSKDMFDMWRNRLVSQHSGRAVDKYDEEIPLPATSRADSDRLISFWLKAAADGWGFRWAVLLIADKTFIGHVGFNALGRCAEIAYHQNPAFWGNGYMSEAAEAAISWCREYGAAELEAFIEPGNEASISLVRRLGMKATDRFAQGAQRYRKVL